MHLLCQQKLILLLPYHLVVKHIQGHTFHHIMSTFHLLCIPVTYYVHMYAIGSPEGVTLLEFEAREED
jgi:hypothetical protein